MVQDKAKDTDNREDIKEGLNGSCKRVQTLAYKWW